MKSAPAGAVCLAILSLHTYGFHQRVLEFCALSCVALMWVQEWHATANRASRESVVVK